MSVKVFDNFLPEINFAAIENAIVPDPKLHGGSFPWFYSQVLNPDTGKDDEPYFDLAMEHNVQMIHMFHDQIPTSPFYNLLTPLINKIAPAATRRIKANLLFRTKEIVTHGFHVDVPKVEMSTAVFYLNTNNGYTVFKSGEKVNSVRNRLVVFPSTLFHSGTTCTDQPFRVVINLNYFNSPSSP